MFTSCSVVVAVFNEADSLPKLLEELEASLSAACASGYFKEYELIFVSDGCTDDSVEILTAWLKTHPNGKLIVFRKNRGKSYALQAGFEEAAGDIIVTLDADLQDDPAELVKLVDKLNEGYDMVCGWKQNRQDPLEKTLPSKLFNWVTGRICGLHLHDFNCGFKAYRKEVAQSLAVYGEFHRYLPVFAIRNGFRVTEIPIHHRKRSFGKSKFGMERYLRGFFDAVSSWFLLKYADRPMYLFGKVGLLCMLLACISIMGAWFAYPGKLVCLIGSGLFLIAGIQFVCLGFLANLWLDYIQYNRRSHIHIKRIICYK